MYQALYRKWRPRTFDDVVGQPHITETLKQQVAGGRTSHAYLFTGTRGTGKTTCAKILSRAVNCQQPDGGNPCNRCPACVGIESGAILDVLELDAASNNGVDQVRALRDEAVYTPAAVGKRVYIVDEVHMLSTPAFNALLKILEEPPPHLMFILATTELHKVPATIRSRCQQFAFKRILPGQIAQRLGEIARQEQIPLTPQGAGLLARLADGGLRDALSLLDQCSGVGQSVDEQTILDTLGLAGNEETVRLMEQVAARDTAAALDTLARLYGNGKDVASVLEELSGLARDLLVRKTAPRGGAALLTGGYEEGAMRTLGESLSAPRLLHILQVLQSTLPDLSRSRSRRTDGELCLIRLCDESLDDSTAGLLARIARLEEQLAQGVSVQAPPAKTSRAKKSEKPAPTSAPQPVKASPVQDLPPWEEERPPLPPEPEEVPSYPESDSHPFPGEQQAPASVPPSPAPAPSPTVTTPPPSPKLPAGGWSWPAFLAGLRGKVPPSALPYLNHGEKVTGTWQNQTLTLWTDSPFTKAMLNKPAILEGLAMAAAEQLGVSHPQVALMVGTPPVQPPVGAAHSEPAPTPEKGREPSPVPMVEAASVPSQPSQEAIRDPFEDLLAAGAQFDNITIH